MPKNMTEEGRRLGLEAIARAPRCRTIRRNGEHCKKAAMKRRDALPQARRPRRSAGTPSQPPAALLNGTMGVREAERDDYRRNREAWDKMTRAGAARRLAMLPPEVAKRSKLVFYLASNWPQIEEQGPLAYQRLLRELRGAWVRGPEVQRRCRGPRGDAPNFPGVPGDHRGGQRKLLIKRLDVGIDGVSLRLRLQLAIRRDAPPAERPSSGRGRILRARGHSSPGSAAPARSGARRPESAASSRAAPSTERADTLNRRLDGQDHVAGVGRGEYGIADVVTYQKPIACSVAAALGAGAYSRTGRRPTAHATLTEAAVSSFSRSWSPQRAGPSFARC